MVTERLERYKIKVLWTYFGPVVGPNSQTANKIIAHFEKIAVSFYECVLSKHVAV